MTAIETNAPPAAGQRTNQTPRGRSYSTRKQHTLALAEQLADERAGWIGRHGFYYEEDWNYMRFLVPEGKRVLDLGCGAGGLLNALKPGEGVGIDFSGTMIERARSEHPHLTFVHGDFENLDELPDLGAPFDFIVMTDSIGALDDCLQTLRALRRYCGPHTRVIVTYSAWFWEPLYAIYSRLTTGRPARPQNWLSSEDIANLLYLADYDVIKREWRVLSPFRLFGLGRLINRFVATLPLIRNLCLRSHVIARAQPAPFATLPSVSIVVPCRNEQGNIEAAVHRTPPFGGKREIIYVEGGCKDGTWEKIQEVIAANPQLTIKAFKQTGSGKGDAVRKGFAEAQGDVLMILDADLTMPPEDLPKFYDALVAGKGEFINGSRLVYPREKDAMRFLNLCANHFFARAFTYLLNQRHTDTLCGTKVLLRRDYDEIARNRAYFGDFDPFGDFDLLFGASKLNLKTAEVPIRYAAREYGETQISRFRHGFLLLRMVIFAFRKLKAM
jgi:SAM-dependent methyltransferase